MEDDVDPDVLRRAGEGPDEEGWRTDPDHPGQERFWDGYEWTDQVRPDGPGVRRPHLPEHVPELQRALAAATADIDSVEDRLSSLFDRSAGRNPPGPRSSTTLLGPLDDHRGQRDVNSGSSSGGNADENWDELDDDDVVLEDFHEDPEEFEGEDDVEVHPAADDLDEDDVLSDVDAALALEAPEEF
jgi:hypothetical protein